MAKSNPFEKLDAALSPESIRAIVAGFGSVADSLKRVWNSLSPQERTILLSSAEDIGTKLMMSAMGAAMTGDMEGVIDKLKKTLGKSVALTTIFEAVKNRG